MLQSRAMLSIKDGIPYRVESLDLQADDRLEAALAYRFKNSVDVDACMFVTAPDRLPNPKLCRFWVLEGQERSSGGRNKHVKFGTHPKTIAVCTENPIRVDDMTESPKLAE
jgi:hypothetical protein